MLVFFALQFGYAASRGTSIETLIIDVATIKPAAALIGLFSPEERPVAEGHRLVSKYVRLTVLNGCEGTETLFLLAAAILAFAAPWRHKLRGILWGGLLIYTLNQIRIIALYYALREDRGLFGAIHGYVGPTLIIVLGCLFFLWWAGAVSTVNDDKAPVI